MPYEYGYPMGSFMVLGVILSAIVSVLFATYAVPRKFSKHASSLYTFWIGVAYFLGSMVLCAVIWGLELRPKENLFSTWHLVSVLRGFVWVMAIVSYNIAIDKIGLVRCNQWKNLQGPVATVLMIALISDVSGQKIIWVVLGTIAMFISAYLFTIPSDHDKKVTISGILWAVLAAVCLGTNAFLNKWVTKQGFIFSQLIYHSMAVVLFAAIIFIIRARKPKQLLDVNKTTWLPLSAGAMYLVATTLSILAYTMISGSVSFGITQLNAVWTILIGIIVFKEVNFKQHWLRVLGGFVFAAGAIALLLFAL